MTEPRKCCKDCENRTPSCHCTCEDYKEYRKALDERNAVINKEKDKRRVMDRYVKDNYRKRAWKK